MIFYEYKAVPAPLRAEKFRGAKTTSERFALTLSGLMNSLGQDGWEYLRADTLPCEERSGLTGRTTNYHALLIFRRALPVEEDTSPDRAPRLEAPQPVAAEIPRLTLGEPGSAPRLGPANG